MKDEFLEMAEDDRYTEESVRLQALGTIIIAMIRASVKEAFPNSADSAEMYSHLLWYLGNMVDAVQYNIDDHIQQISEILCDDSSTK